MHSKSSPSSERWHFYKPWHRRASQSLALLLWAPADSPLSRLSERSLPLGIGLTFWRVSTEMRSAGAAGHSQHSREDGERVWMDLKAPHSPNTLPSDSPRCPECHPMPAYTTGARQKRGQPERLPPTAWGSESAGVGLGRLIPPGKILHNSETQTVWRGAANTDLPDPITENTLMAAQSPSLSRPAARLWGL